MKRSLLWGALFGAAYAYCVTRPASVRVSADVDSDPEAYLEQVARVEREPELIPFVSAVTVEERSDDTVRYRVEVSVEGIPGWARFRKCIRPPEGRAEWATLDGPLGFDQQGELICERTDGPNRATVSTVTRFGLPVIGPVLAHLSTPVLAAAFAAWLKNLDAAAKGASPDRESADIPA